MRSSLRLVLACSIAVGLALFSGCGQRETAVQSGNRQQILHYGNLVEPTDLDPHIITSQQDFNLVQALFEGLTQYDPEKATPVPAVAERWEVSADNLTWTFHLRNTAKWSNGDPVTAHDFVFAYRRMLSPNLAAEYAYLLFALKNGEAFTAGKIKDPELIGARAADDYTLVLTLDHPVPYLPSMTCHASWFPLHRATLEKFGKSDQRGTAWTRPGNMVSNGYFILKEWDQHRSIHMVKSPTYWDRDNVKLNEVYFYPIESGDSEERAFRAGQLHVTATLPTPKIAVYESQPDVFHPHVFLGTSYYRLNVTKPPLNDARVRRALALSIDRDRLVREVMRGHQLPARHLTPPDTAGFNAPDQISDDLATAQKLLSDAGFPEGKGFPHLDILVNTNNENIHMAEAIQQMWRKGLGIDIGIYNQESKVQSDSMRAMNYQIGRYAWIGDYLDPSTFLELLAGDSGNNMTGWKNEEYDRLIAAAQQTADQAKRYEYFQRCEQILGQECPIIPMYFYTRLNLRRPEVKGWYSNILDQHPLKGVYLAP
jgi:oligopeptide transport system substrate-binding protein